MRVFMSLLATGVMGMPLMAHEGHGAAGEGHTATHYMTEPIHLVSTFLVLAALSAISVVAYGYWNHQNSNSKTSPP